MRAQVIWNGTREESFDLLNAVARNCGCEFGWMGVRLATCAPHQMLVDDQRALNGLVFVRRIADRLRREEWLSGGVGEDAAALQPSDDEQLAYLAVPAGS